MIRLSIPELKKQIKEFEVKLDDESQSYLKRLKKELKLKEGEL
jgi:vacuolar-type H+-ATPase subunit D/Vma8